MQRSESVRLKENKVKDMMVGKKEASGDALHDVADPDNDTLVANKIVPVAVAGPPSSGLEPEYDKQTGVVRKHYIGMVIMLNFFSNIYFHKSSI